MLETVHYLSWLFGDAPLGVDAIGEMVDGQFRHLVFNEVDIRPTFSLMLCCLAFQALSTCVPTCPVIRISQPDFHETDVQAIEAPDVRCGRRMYVLKPVTQPEHGDRWCLPAERLADISAKCARLSLLKKWSLDVRGFDGTFQIGQVHGALRAGIDGQASQLLTEIQTDKKNTFQETWRNRSDCHFQTPQPEHGTRCQIVAAQESARRPRLRYQAGSD